MSFGRGQGSAAIRRWPADDIRRRVRRPVEHAREGDDPTDEEWRIFEEHAARRDLASDEEVEAVFSGYRIN